MDWEGALITQEIYASRTRNLKFVPIFLSTVMEDWIPEPLRSSNYYPLNSKIDYESLYDHLLTQSGVEPGEVGSLKSKPRRRGFPLTFDEQKQPLPPPLPPHPTTPEASLYQILVGRWQIRIQPPFGQGVIGQLNLDLFPNGMFRGQLVYPMAVTGVEGQWQANPIQNQIGLQGMQSNGFQIIPYSAWMQITGFSPQQFQGVGSSGEQVYWQRVNPPNMPPPMAPF